MPWKRTLDYISFGACRECSRFDYLAASVCVRCQHIQSVNMLDACFLAVTGRVSSVLHLCDRGLAQTLTPASLPRRFVEQMIDPVEVVIDRLEIEIASIAEVVR